MAERDSKGRLSRSLRIHVIAGTAVIATLVGGVGAWAAVSSLSGAVVASGRLVVQGNVKKVQHPTGGVVGEIHVKAGDRVKAGDLVIRLDETVLRANLGVYESQLRNLEARAARLRAERSSGEALDVSADLEAQKSEPEIAAMLSSEQRLLDARRQSNEGRRARLGERIAQFREQITGLEAQREAKGKEIVLADDEFKDLKTLSDKKLVQRSRVTALERDRIRLESERGQLTSSIAEIRGRISESELAILAVDEEFRAGVLEELRAAESEIAQIKERLTAAREELARTEIRAPIDGAIHELAVHTIRGVIQPGETVMLIVPDADNLVAEASVRPQDIDQIHVGQPARLLFSAFSSRSTPSISGTINLVSAELTLDERSGMSFYTVHIAPDAGEVTKLAGQQLVAGMPVEVFIATGERTALSWLMKPLTDSMSRALRED